MFSLTPCSTCGCAGGGVAGIAFDPETGPVGPRQPLVCTTGISLDEWLEKHAGRSFGTHLDPWFQWMRTR